MKTITLTPKQSEIPALDFVGVKLEDWISLSPDQISRHCLPSVGQETEVGEVWQVHVQSNEEEHPILVMQGDCHRVRALGHQHRRGEILVQGNIGHHCGACMLGGTIRIEGNAGDHLGATVGTRGVGMNGGVLSVRGNAGDLAGHRMRRGELNIDGDAGDGVASWQVAGTIRVGGRIGKNVAYGMRRGTLVLNQPVQLPHARFTDPVELDTPFASLLAIASAGEDRWTVRRGDRSIGGIGEVWISS